VSYIFHRLFWFFSVIRSFLSFLRPFWTSYSRLFLINSSCIEPLKYPFSLKSYLKRSKVSYSHEWYYKYQISCPCFSLLFWKTIGIYLFSLIVYNSINISLYHEPSNEFRLFSRTQDIYLRLVGLFHFPFCRACRLDDRFGWRLGSLQRERRLQRWVRSNIHRRYLTNGK
jgi:hypothetical protein